MLEPITHLHVAAFAKVNETMEVLRTLLERAAELSTRDPDGPLEYDEAAFFWQHFEIAGTWCERLDDCHLELVASDTDGWVYDRAAEPRIRSRCSNQA